MATSKPKLINKVYNGIFDGMDVNQAEELYQRAKGKYQDKLDEFDRLWSKLNSI